MIGLNMGLDDWAVVFVGGVHGVGKTSFCSELASTVGAKHVSAGEIIKLGLGDRNDKVVQNVGLNQEILIGGLSRLSTGDTKILLDGHFCVLGQNCVPQRISISTFVAIKPSMFFLLTAPVTLIAKRLAERDGQSALPILALDELQIAERLHARSIAGALGIPIHEIELENDDRGNKIKLATQILTGKTKR